jgi:hypothetical protein
MIACFMIGRDLRLGHEQLALVAGQQARSPCRWRRGSRSSAQRVLHLRQVGGDAIIIPKTVETAASTPSPASSASTRSLRIRTWRLGSRRRRRRRRLARRR